jgi:polynucleotide 5'-kinase involved in rRNA processing
LSHPYFYDGDAVEAQAYSVPRELRFQNRTILEVLTSFDSIEQLKANMTTLALNAKKVAPFENLAPLEDRLLKRIISVEELTAMGKSPEVRRLEERFVDLDSSQNLLRNVTKTEENEDEKREEPICFVLGRSGSGKTFFAIGYAATFGVKDRRHTTLYVHQAWLLGICCREERYAICGAYERAIGD